jgi:hypothetical protein
MRMTLIYLTLKMVGISCWVIKLDVARVAYKWWFSVFHIDVYAENGLYYLAYIG